MLTFSQFFFFGGGGDHNGQSETNTTETNINGSPSKHVDEILDDWKVMHKNTQHGLALCYNVR